MALVILNFKAYEEAIGDNSIKLAQIAKDVSEKNGIQIIASPQAFDLAEVSKIIETMAQHIDPINLGAGTGSLVAESAKQAGAVGSLLNHSEKRIPREEIQKGIAKLRSLGMQSVVCAKDPEESKDLASLDPDYIAVEPPELIGSGISVSTAKPEVITQTIDKIKEVNSNVKILCGAGVSNGNDVKKALELGVEGVLLASAFTKSHDPKKTLEDICGGFK